MSTILDALKKSEQERKQQRLPTLMDSPLPKESPKWPWLLVGLCMVFLAAGLLYVLWQLPSQNGQANTASPESKYREDKSATISATESQTRAAMDLSVISYAEDAQQRFVMIDENLLREGDYLSAGIRVIEIKPDSVIIDQRGDRIELRP